MKAGHGITFKESTHKDVGPEYEGIEKESRYSLRQYKKQFGN